MYYWFRYKEYDGCFKATLLSILLGVITYLPIRFALAGVCAAYAAKLVSGSVSIEYYVSLTMVSVFVLVFILMGVIRNILEKCLEVMANKAKIKNTDRHKDDPEEH